jgi:pimeloyl-ACP methyl ester carboxylesterase
MLQTTDPGISFSPRATRRSLAARRVLGLLAATVFAVSACSAQTPACAGLQRRPVVFVHGSGLAPDSWREMVAVFNAQGYPASHLVPVRLVPDNGSNIRAAEQFIAPAVRETLAAARRAAERAGCRAPERVDVVAHSMGAVSARWYVAKIESGTVRNLVGIAPANHGTDALCGHTGDGNRELCPAFAQSPVMSAVQHALNGSIAAPVDETPFGLGADGPGRPSLRPASTGGIYYWSIRLDPDEWIKPAASALLDGAGGRALPSLPPGVRETSPGNVLWRAGVSHDDLPRNPDLIRFVMQLLLMDEPGPR